MKASIFNTTFVLPPMVVMTEVEKEMPTVSTNSPADPVKCSGYFPGGCN